MTFFALATRCGVRDEAAWALSPMSADRATAPKPQPALWRKSRRDEGRSNRLQDMVLMEVEEFVGIEQHLAEIVHCLMIGVVRFHRLAV